MKNEIIRELGGYVARHRYARISSRKARLVADAIRGRAVNDALEILELLPLLTNGCQRFVILAGPTYSSRLWAVTELFCFLKGGGDEDGEGVLHAPIDRVTVLPFTDGDERHTAPHTY